MLENASIRRPMHNRLGNLVQVVLVPLVAGEPGPRGAVADFDAAGIAHNVAICAAACELGLAECCLPSARGRETDVIVRHFGGVLKVLEVETTNNKKSS